MFASRTNWRLEPNWFARAIEARQASGQSIIDLTASNPTACGFKYPEREILEAISDPRALRYAPEPKGIQSARETVAAYYAGARRFGGAGGSIDPERIVLASGTSEAYSHVFRLLCEPGDEVLVPAPSYPLFQYLADTNDVRLGHYPLFYDHGWHIDFDALKKAATERTRAVLVVHPNNPTGSFVKEREVQQLSELCSTRHMAIVADEVFLDFADAGVRPPSFAFEQQVLTFTLSGLSKICALPQMKLAWMIASGPAAQPNAAIERLEIIADTYLSVGTPVQLALPRLLGLRGELQSQLRARIQANLTTLDTALAKHPHVTRLEREGGWYTLLRAPNTQSGEEFAIALLEMRGVLVHPGQFFDFGREGFLVVSLIAPAEEFRRGIGALLEHAAL